MLERCLRRQSRSSSRPDRRTALRPTTVQCWGNAKSAILGNGTMTGPDKCPGGTCSTAPIAVTGLTGATTVSPDGFTVCASLSGER
jgi:hypothetical protein